MIRRVGLCFEQQHRKKLMQFAEFLGRQAVQFVHGDKRDHVILLFRLRPDKFGPSRDQEAQEAAVIGHLRAKRIEAGTPPWPHAQPFLPFMISGSADGQA